MLKTLLIKETEETPQVLFDKQNGKFEINGRSFPEDARKFYSSVIRWVDAYVKEPCEETVFCFNLEYFNSSSMKQLIEILIRLKAIDKAGKKITIIWSYDKHDELMEAKGEEMQNMINLSFELNPIG